MVLIDILEEPVGDIYKQLLAAVADLARTVLLVRDTTYPLSDLGLRLLDDLERYELSRDHRSTWPGTRLLEGAKEVRTYTVNHHVLELITAAADRLYGWLQPELPEDPSFCRADGTPVLTTISHERDSYLTLAGDELDRIQPEIQGIVYSVRFSE